jgi:glycosyltransferase involved in cell wall biosynthesis
MVEPRIDVIVPTLNRPKQLSQCLESILNQTYNNLRIIIVDGGNTSRTEEIINESHREANEIEILHVSQSSKGIAAARNEGISKSNAGYVAFLDDDDIWHSKKLELQQQKLSKTNEVGLVYTGVDHRTKEGSQIGRRLPEYEGDIYEQLLIRNEIGTLSSVLVGSEVISEVAGFDEKLTICEDWDFYIRVSKSFKISCVNKLLVTKQFHSDSVLDKLNEHIKNKEYVIQKHLQDIGGRERLSEANFYKYRDIGIQYCLRGDMNSGREMFRNASRHKRDPTLAILFMLSYLGDRIFRSIGMMKTSFDYYLQRFDIAETLTI